MKSNSDSPSGAPFMLLGASIAAVGGLLKWAASRSNEEARHLRRIPQMSLDEIAAALRTAPPGTRLYAAAEGLLTPKGNLIDADGDSVIYRVSSKVEVSREWKWVADRPAGRGGRNNNNNNNNNNQGRRSRRSRRQQESESGHWKSEEHESATVEKNVKNAGIAYYSGDTVAHLMGGAAEWSAVAALLVKHSEAFEAKHGGGNNVIINNNNGGGRNTDRNRPPPPETLGFRKTQHVIPNNRLIFTVGEFYPAEDAVSKHQRNSGVVAPPTTRHRNMLAVGPPVNPAALTGKDGTDVTPTFRVGYGTLTEHIANISAHSRALDTGGNVTLGIGGCIAVGGLIKYAYDQAKARTNNN